ncbi:M20 family metallopeptidase [Amycolatopsis pithecellobii]|uniref:M20 family metallopeptidase n=1 Tax=Amycolatopsis pithecellobii TaxID=664692 RepID=UPI0014097781|nr:M20/M25/M40 family metallo-hydrolase [Amycolatopsis pithecellobii]
MSEQPGSATWLSRLVSIPSVNPAHAGPRSGAGGEAAISAAVAGWAEELGAEWVRTHGETERRNVYAFFPGRSRRLLALDVHFDTVGVEQMTEDPFSGAISGGRVWGRGAVDAKPMLAAALAMLEQFAADGIRPERDFLLVGTIAEESGGFRGAELFAEWVRENSLPLSELLIAEPTAGAPVFGHQGGVGVEFVIEGRTAHSSRPEVGANAIDAAADIVTAIRTEHGRLRQATAGALLGPASVSTVEISGGGVRNMVPGKCSVFATRRLTDHETMQQAADELIAIARAASPLPFTTTVGRGGNPFLTSADDPLVRRLAELSGRKPGVSSLGTNAFRYEGLAAHTAVFGPGSPDQAHAPQEWCEIGELEKARAVLTEYLLTPVEDSPQ